MIKLEEVYKIGVLGKPHGIKGEIQFYFEDDTFDTADADYLVLMLDGILVPFFIEEYRFKSNETALIKFCDIDTTERAAELTGTEVYLPRNIKDDDDTLTFSQISGFSLIDFNTNNVIGKIKRVDDSTANILFEVEDADGDTMLIPAAEDFIKNINKDGQTITVDLPEGLLDL